MFFLLLTTHGDCKQVKHLSQVGNRFIAGLLFLALCTVLAGCSLTPSDYLSERSGRPTKAMVEDVPFFAQDELQCGPAALAMVLNWSGVTVQPSELSSEVYTPGLKGSLQNALIGSAPQAWSGCIPH